MAGALVKDLWWRPPRLQQMIDGKPFREHSQPFRCAYIMVQAFRYDGPTTAYHSFSAQKRARLNALSMHRWRPEGGEGRGEGPTTHSCMRSGGGYELKGTIHLHRQQHRHIDIESERNRVYSSVLRRAPADSSKGRGRIMDGLNADVRQHETSCCEQRRGWIVLRERQSTAKELF